jgi:hypothetical protein
MLTLEQFNYTWRDNKVVVRNLAENCKIMIFITGILPPDIRVINRRR